MDCCYALLLYVFYNVAYSVVSISRFKKGSLMKGFLTWPYATSPLFYLSPNPFLIASPHPTFIYRRGCASANMLTYEGKITHFRL